MKRKHAWSRSILLVGLLGSVSAALAQNWVKVSAPNLSWASVASSADGVYLVAAPSYGHVLYSSTNSGVSWLTNHSTSYDIYWKSVASSADGKNLVAAGPPGGAYSPIYVSTNSGLDWIATGGVNLNWHCVASSADGVQLFAGVPTGQVYKFMNSGNYWKVVCPSNAMWWSMASSSDGNRVVAVACYGGVYVSTNSGGQWTKALGDSYWEGVACSSDGSKLVVASDSQTPGGGLICTSTNGGASWTTNNVPRWDWHRVASSADGMKLAAVCNGYIYTSTNGGGLWFSNNVAINNWVGVASSADGAKLVAVYSSGSSTGGIYVSQVVPSPQLSLSVTNSNLLLSWVIPSANFVLQQNWDFAAPVWLTVTNVPVTDLTVMRNEVVLPILQGKGFYRLATP